MLDELHFDGSCNSYSETFMVGLGWFGFFNFGSIHFSIPSTRFRFFSVSVFAHHRNERVP